MELDILYKKYELLKPCCFVNLSSYEIDFVQLDMHLVIQIFRR